MEEKWCTPPGYAPYLVSNLGRIKNRMGVILGARARNNGYVPLHLRIEGEPNRVYMHQLVARAFIENPGGKPHVNHINGIRDDNRAENLEWVTAQENAQRKVFPKPVELKTAWKKVVQLTMDGTVVRVWDSLAEAARSVNVAHPNITCCCSGRQKSAGGFRWAYQVVEAEPEDPTEEWKTIRYKMRTYTASSRGRIRLTSGITLGSLNGGYLSVNGTDSVHRIIATAFHPNPDGKPQVNHKDGNKTNNSADNLEWATAGENSRHYQMMGPKKPPKSHKRAVQQLAMEGELIATHESIAAASQATKQSAGNIGSACRGKVYKSVGGFRWKYVDSGEVTAAVFKSKAPQKPYTRKGYTGKVRQLTLDGELVAIHNSLAMASKAVKQNPSNISRACRGIQYTSVGGFRWEHAGPEEVAIGPQEPQPSPAEGAGDDESSKTIGDPENMNTLDDDADFAEEIEADMDDDMAEEDGDLIDVDGLMEFLDDGQSTTKEEDKEDKADGPPQAPVATTIPDDDPLWADFDM